MTLPRITSTAELRMEIQEKIGALILDDGEIALLAEIFSRYNPKTFSESIAQNEEEMNRDDPKFFGKKGYDKEQDQKRLTKQMYAMFSYMLDDKWHTLQEIADGAPVTITSIRARMSDLRHPRWGGHTILAERKKEGKGTWYYRLIPNKESLTWKEYEKNPYFFSKA
jgi:hypothetical protein